MRSNATHPRRAACVSSLNAFSLSRTTFALFTSLYVLSLSGCSNEGNDKSGVEVTRTSSSQRALRRAYDGAPPVIPHPVLGATCTECHTNTGKAVPDRGFAPANPHLRTVGLSATANCRQCHVFKNATDEFRENDFIGLAQTFDGGDAMYEGAPPVMPHPVFMRENCTACHDGPSARPEIRCSHAGRVNCRQCHMSHNSDAEAFSAALPE